MGNTYAAAFLVAMSIMIVIGIRQHRVVKFKSGKYHIKMLYDDGIYTVVTAIMAVPFAMGFTVVDYYYQNRVLTSRPILMTIIFILVVYATGRIASWARCGYLHEKLRMLS